MSEAELRKIVNDGYNKFKNFEEGKAALDALDGLNQAKSDLTKTVKDLESNRDALLVEASKLNDKIKEAEETATFKIQTAEAKAESILSAVDDSIKDLQKKADKKLKEALQRTIDQEALEDAATKKAVEAQAKLNAINAELESSSARFKALVG